MNKKNRIVLLTSTIALIIVLISISYAYFSARITGTESTSTIILVGGRLEITYSEGNDAFRVENIYPREEAWVTKHFTLTGFNNTDLKMKYGVGFEIIENTFTPGYLTYELTLDSSDSGTTIPNSTGIISKSGTQVLGYGEFLTCDNDKHNYTLKIYFKNKNVNQINSQGAVMSGKIVLIEDGIENKIAGAPITYCSTGFSTLERGTEFVHGQYTYRYLQEYTNANGWQDLANNGWGIVLTDVVENGGASTDPVTSEVCTYIDDLPVISSSATYYNSQATSIDLSTFNTENIKNAFTMFRGAAAESLDLSTFDTSNMTNMESMFNKSKATSLDLSKFNTKNVTNMRSMFNSMPNILSLDLSSFDTSNVTNMRGMFYGLESLTSLDVSSFDTSNTTSMDNMFSNLKSLASLNLSNFDTSNVTNMSGMFMGCSSVSSINLTSFNTSNVTDMECMFYEFGTAALNLTNFNTDKVTNMKEMFKFAQSATINTSSFTTSVSSLDMTSMFQDTAKLNTIDLRKLDTSKAELSNIALHTNAKTGYAKTSADATRLNNSGGKPTTLTFKTP